MSRPSHILLLTFVLAGSAWAAEPAEKPESTEPAPAPAPAPAAPAIPPKWTVAPKATSSKAAVPPKPAAEKPDRATAARERRDAARESNFLRIRRRLEEQRARAAGRPVKRKPAPIRRPATKPAPKPAPRPDKDTGPKPEPKPASRVKPLTRAEIREQERVDAERERLFGLLFPED